MSPDFSVQPDPSFSPFASPLTWQLVDDLGDGQRPSSYPDAERLCKGPEPVPAWVVTERAAVDTELGILKTGKEADCFLLERAVPGGRSSVLAVKRYRGQEHTLFHRGSEYAEGRRTRRSRDARALARKSRWGRVVEASQWAWTEWDALKRLWLAGVAVPYPVQYDGTDILMELVTVDGLPAPRLAGERPSPARLAAYFDQLREALIRMAALGLTHGDLSPYNVLAAGDRLVLIDLPQVVDLVANPGGLDFLLRDCRNICAWFERRGLEVDAEVLFADLLTQVL